MFAFLSRLRIYFLGNCPLSTLFLSTLEVGKEPMPPVGTVPLALSFPKMVRNLSHFKALTIIQTFKPSLLHFSCTSF